jgi:hypothetical protein
MALKSQTLALGLALPFALTLAACGGKDKPENAATAESNATAGATAASAASSAAPATNLTLAQGPDVCFRAIAAHLGADVKVSEISSFFSTGTEIDGNARKPEGALTTCSVQYQNPEDPRKLLSISMNTDTGQFGTPNPVEIRVTGGNAADFKLEDHLIPLSSVNAAALAAIMDQQKTALSGAFSRYAFSGVRLMGPGAFDDKHRLRLDVDGRLASNDIKESGYAEISVDGQNVVNNRLTPR